MVKGSYCVLMKILKRLFSIHLSMLILLWQFPGIVTYFFIQIFDVRKDNLSINLIPIGTGQWDSNETHGHFTENQRSYIWQLCLQWWQCKLSLRQLTVPPVTTKSSNWRPLVFSVMAYSAAIRLVKCNPYLNSQTHTLYLIFAGTFWALIGPWENIPDNKVHGDNMGPTGGRQDPGRPHVGHINIAIWDDLVIMGPQYIFIWYNQDGRLIWLSLCLTGLGLRKLNYYILLLPLLKIIHVIAASYHLSWVPENDDYMIYFVVA